MCKKHKVQGDYKLIDEYEFEDIQTTVTVYVLNNKKGYIANNIVLTCYLCNATKNCYWNYEEMLEIGKFLQKTRKKRVTTSK